MRREGRAMQRGELDREKGEERGGGIFAESAAIGLFFFLNVFF